MPQCTRIDVSSLVKLRDWPQQYLGDITQHLRVYIPLGLVIGCGSLFKIGPHGEEGKPLLHEAAVFVPYRGIDISNCEIEQPSFLVAGEVHELGLV